MISDTPKYNLTEEVTNNLRDAIVLRACNDYITSKRCILGLTDEGVRDVLSTISNTRKTLDECIDFFESDYFCNLMGIFDEYEDLPASLGRKVMQRLDYIVYDTERWPKTGNVLKYEQDVEDLLEDIAS